MTPSFGMGAPSKSHMLDADVIVEPFLVPERAGCEGRMEMQSRRAVRRERPRKGRAKHVGLQKPGQSQAAGRVGLLHICGPGLQHAAEIVKVIAIFPRRDLHPIRRPIPDKAKPLQIVAGNGLFKVDDAE